VNHWFHPEARAEFLDSVRYYESQQPGLGRRFLEAVTDTIRQLEAHPNRYRVVSGTWRQCRVPRFPFGLIYKVRNNTDLFSHLYEKKHLDDDPDLVVVSYGTPSRVVNTAVERARAEGLNVGALRLINLWPFPDEHFQRPAKYLAVELNWDGELVREVQRAAAEGSEVHFLGVCGDLPTIPDLLEVFDKVLKNQPLERRGWQLEAW